MIKKVDKIYTIVEDHMLALLMGLMALAIFSQIICRNFLGTSLPWSEELARYCMIWIGFFGIGAGLKENAHIGFEAIINLLPKRILYFVSLLTKVVIAALCLIFFFLSLQLTINLYGTGQKAPTLQIPIALVYMVIPIGFFFGFIRSVTQIAASLLNRKMGDKTNSDMIDDKENASSENDTCDVENTDYADKEV